MVEIIPLFLELWVIKVSVDIKAQLLEPLFEFHRHLFVMMRMRQKNVVHSVHGSNSKY